MLGAGGLEGVGQGVREAQGWVVRGVGLEEVGSMRSPGWARRYTRKRGQRRVSSKGKLC